MSQLLVTEVDGILWYRICQDCGVKQSEGRDVNEPCENCGCAVVLSMPLNSGYEDIEL